MVDYTMLAQTPFVDMTEIGNALARRQQLQEQPMRQMQAAADLERAKIQNRLSFMQETQAAEAEKIQRAQRETAMNIGVPAAQVASVAAPPPPPQNALTGMPQAPTAAPTPQGWRPPMALPPEGGQNAMAAPTPAAAPTPSAPQSYSPEAWGKFSATEAKRLEAMKEAKDTFSTLLKSAVDTGSQEMTDSLLRAAKKSPALSSMVGWVGDPDGPENQRLQVVGKGVWKTESSFTQEQLVALAKNASSEVVRNAIVNAKPGTYAIEGKGSSILEFKPATAGVAHLSDIGKLQRERDAKIEARKAEGKTTEDAMKDPDVIAYNAEIKKKSEPKETAARDRYLSVKTRMDQKDPTVTPEEKSYVKSYEHEKTLGPEAYGAMRLEMLLQNPIGVYDTNNGSVGFKTKKEINQGDAENTAKGLPPRYVPGELATKLKSRNAIMEEIATSSEIARKALKSLKNENFSQTQLMKFADQLKVDDGGSRITSFLSSNFAKTLSPAEIEYVTAIRNLRESSFSLRTVGGMGQGSDMLRAAITEMIPGTRTPNKKMANSALDKFDIQVDRLWSGIPGIGNEPTTRRKDVGKAEVPKDNVAPAGTQIKTKDGKILTSDGAGGWK